MQSSKCGDEEMSAEHGVVGSVGISPAHAVAFVLAIVGHGNGVAPSRDTSVQAFAGGHGARNGIHFVASLSCSYGPFCHAFGAGECWNEATRVTNSKPSLQ